MDKYLTIILFLFFRPWIMETSTQDEEAPKDPGASKALTGIQDNDIFGKFLLHKDNCK